MPKYTPEQRQKIEGAVLHAEIARLSEAEAIDYIHQITGITLDHNALQWRKRNLKHQRIGLMQSLKENRYAYKLVFVRRIEELERCMEIAQKDMLKYMNDEKRFFFKQKLVYEIIELNKQLTDLYLLLPMIDAAIARTNGPLDTQTTYQQLPESQSAEAAGDLSEYKF
jgi:hypothetical protein